jgi:Fic family protein
MTQARGSSLAIALVDSLFEFPVVTIPRAGQILGVTYRSAHRNVQKLVEAGILKQMSEFVYNKVFIAEDIIRIVRDT